jgi:probable phosphoglycerate mutase
MTNELSRHAAGQREFRLPDGATNVFMIRHGATVWPATAGDPGISCSGRPEPSLSDLGRDQADRVAQRLAKAGLTRIFTTGVRRTQETARPLADRLGIAPTSVSALQEVDLGDWNSSEGLERLISDDPVAIEVFRQERWDLIPGAEPMDRLAARVRQGIEELVAQAGAGSAAAFLHAGTIAEVCRQATASRPFAFIHVSNCSISQLVVLADESWVLHAFNDTAHLRSPTAEPVL